MDRLVGPRACHLQLWLPSLALLQPLLPWSPVAALGPLALHLRWLLLWMPVASLRLPPLLLVQLLSLVRPATPAPAAQPVQPMAAPPQAAVAWRQMAAVPWSAVVARCSLGSARHADPTICRSPARLRAGQLWLSVLRLAAAAAALLAWRCLEGPRLWSRVLPTSSASGAGLAFVASLQPAPAPPTRMQPQPPCRLRQQRSAAPCRSSRQPAQPCSQLLCQLAATHQAHTMQTCTAACATGSARSTAPAGQGTAALLRLTAGLSHLVKTPACQWSHAPIPCCSGACRAGGAWAVHSRRRREHHKQHPTRALQRLLLPRSHRRQPASAVPPSSAHSIVSAKRSSAPKRQPLAPRSSSRSSSQRNRAERWSSPQAWSSGPSQLCDRSSSRHCRWQRQQLLLLPNLHCQLSCQRPAANSRAATLVCHSQGDLNQTARARGLPA